MKRILIVMCAITVIVFPVVPSPARGEFDTPSEQEPHFYLFHSYTCASCREARRFVQELAVEYPDIVFHELEIVKSRKNQEVLMNFVEELGISTPGVPVFVFRDRYLVGFGTKSNRREIISWISRYRLKKKGWYGHKIPGVRAGEQGSSGEGIGSNLPLPLFTLLLGLFDGFNPCALWVLMFLLTLLVSTRNRQRLLMVGFVFTGGSALIYLFFMTAWYRLFVLFGAGRYVQLVLAITVVIIGIINAKELFFFKRGPTLMIPEKALPSLFRRMRAVANNPSGPLTALSALLLALIVNLIEFGCTIGLPAVYTNALSRRSSGGVAYLYLVLYTAAYVTPLICVVLIFAFVMGKYRLGERYGRVLKGTNGVLMLILGAMLLAGPSRIHF